MAVQILAGYWDLDLETRELLLCPRSRQMFGIEGSSPKKLGKQDWLPRVHPDDMPIIEGELETARSRNDVYSARFRAVRPDGSFLQMLGVGRAAARNSSRFVGLNFDLAATASSAELESRRLGGAMAKLAGVLAIRSRPANENETPWWHPRSAPGGTASALDKSAMEDSQRQTLLRRALATMEMRQLRHRFLNPAMFGEPAFDLLLALYVTNASPAIMSLRTLSSVIGVSESCAARWLKLLVTEGLVLSVDSEAEPDAVQAALTDRGRIVLDDYFMALGKAQ